MKPNSLTDMLELAAIHNGVCLSENYCGYDKLLKWKCKKGHIFERTPRKVIEGKWCTECIKTERNAKQYQRLKEIVEVKGGTLLSTDYINDETKVNIACSKGHEFSTTPYNIKREIRDTWCPKCNSSPKKGIEEAQQIALSWGGRCLSTEYINAKTPLDFECKNGHQFSSCLKDVKNHWCRICRRKEAKEPRQIDLEMIKELAKERNLECLSDSYINTKMNMKFRCLTDGNVFEKRVNNFLNGQGCPECSRRKKIRQP